MAATRIQEWQSYPSCLPTCFYDVDRKTSGRMLDAAEDRLFSSDDDVEVWTHEVSLDGGEGEKIGWGKLIWQDLERKQHGKTSIVYFLHQPYSWGSLQISKDTLKKMLTAHTVSSIFLDAIHAFGSKVSGEDDPYFGICHHTISQMSQELGGTPNTQGYEFAFTLRSYEKHKRPGLKWPWSLRQMFVFQNYNVQTQTSVWIIIQPLKNCKTTMRERVAVSKHPMCLHPLFLHLGLRSWRWYLNDVRLALSSIAEKARHSSLKLGDIDYDANFADSQRLTKWCETLTIVQNILASYADVGEAIQIHCSELRQMKSNFAASDADLLARVRLDLQRVKGFRRTAICLMKQAEATSQLLVKLLDYQRVDKLNVHVEELRSLAVASSIQGESLTNLTEKTRYDSRYMRILTFAALVYLPASLLAVNQGIFSTDLVRVSNPVNGNHSSPLIVGKALWIYAVVSAAMTVVTLGCATVWTRRSEGSHLFRGAQRRP